MFNYPALVSMYHRFAIIQTTSLKFVVGLLCTAIILSACGGGGNGSTTTSPPPVAYSYSVPESLNDGWAVGHLNDHGIDAALISTMVDDIDGPQFTGIDSISIVRNNTLVLSESFRQRLDEFDSWSENTDLDTHILHSTSKSFISALAGIAIDQGYIDSTEVSFYSLFAYANYENWDTRKSTMTLDDALTMRFGYPWDEWSEPYGDPENTLSILTANNSDYSRALLDLPIATTPGSNFVYNTAGTVAIGQAIENSVGIPLEDFAQMHLFAALQITDAVWGETPSGLPNGGSGLFLTTREMVKFGQLYIADGKWQNEQVVSAEWVQRSILPYNELSWGDTSGYGYQWWIDRFTVGGQAIVSYSTRGYGGQYIFCVPSLQLVVAFTGRNYGTDGAGLPFDLMQQFILPAMQ